VDVASIKVNVVADRPTYVTSEPVVLRPHDEVSVIHEPVAPLPNNIIDSRQTVNQVNPVNLPNTNDIAPKSHSFYVAGLVVIALLGVTLLLLLVVVGVRRRRGLRAFYSALTLPVSIVELDCERQRSLHVRNDGPKLDSELQSSAPGVYDGPDHKAAGDVTESSNLRDNVDRGVSD